MRTIFVFVISVMILLSSIEAYAGFEMGRLIQVVYKNDDKEVGTDLLGVNTFDFAQQNIQLAPAGTFNLDQFTTTNAWGDLQAGFFAHFAGSGQGHAWFATTQPTAPAVNTSSLGGFFGGSGPIGTYYNGLSQSTTAIGDPNYPGSYWVKMNSRTTPGQYAGYNKGYETSPGSGQYEKHGEAVLGPFETTGYVDMYLYHFNLSQLVPGPGGTPYTAVLRLLSDGSTLLNPTSGTTGPPVINEVGDVTIGTDKPYVVQVTLSEGQSPDLVWTVDGPSGMTISGSGRISWPSPTVLGSPHTVAVRAENGEGFDQTSWVVTVIEGYTPSPDGDICEKVKSEVVGKTFVTRLDDELFDVSFSETIVMAGCPFGSAELIDRTFGSLGAFPYDTLPDFNVAGLGLRMEGEIIVQDIPNVLVLQFASSNSFAVYIGGDRYQGIVSGSRVTITGDGGSWDFSWSKLWDDVTIEGIRFHRLFHGYYATASVLVLAPKD